MEERAMSNEDKVQAAGQREPGFRGVEARPRNWLVPVILLSLREWNSYGYELMERASAFGFEAMNPGTLYRTLRQMEKEGVVESSWETSGGGRLGGGGGGAGFGVRVRGDEPRHVVPDAPADGERGRRRVQLGGLQGGTGAPDVHHHGRRQRPEERRGGKE